MEVLSNVMIRIYKFDHSELVFEDFFMTNTNGITLQIPLYAPAREFSLKKGSKFSYESYQLELRCKGYQTKIIQGIQIFADEHSNIIVSMKKADDRNENIVQETQILQHTLDSDTRLPKVVLLKQAKKKMIIPEFITVHLGKAEDLNAKNQKLTFIEFLKNSACCELYPTWPHEVLKANIILLTTMIINNLQQYKEDIYDVTLDEIRYEPQRNLYPTISNMVEDIYGFVAYSTNAHPYYQIWDPWMLLTMQQSTCDAYTILKYFTQIPIALEKAPEIYKDYIANKMPMSYGSSCKEVGVLKIWLKEILQRKSHRHTLSNFDNVYDDEMEMLVKSFQQQFHLIPSGIVDRKTYFKIHDIKIREERIQLLPKKPQKNTILDTQEISIVKLQEQLRVLAKYYPILPICEVTGTFTNNTSIALIAFQRMLGIVDDGIVESKSYQLLQQVYQELLTKR